MSPHRVTAGQLLSVECITRGHPLPELAEAIERELGEAEQRGFDRAVNSTAIHSIHKAVAAERAAVCEWLRSDDSDGIGIADIADAIERGVHREEKP